MNKLSFYQLMRLVLFSVITFLIFCISANAGSASDLPVNDQHVQVADERLDSQRPEKGTLLLEELFADNNWASRGWYDGTTSTGVAPGGRTGDALRWSWNAADKRPDGFSTIRRQFAAVDEFVIEFFVRYESGWQGSGLNWHPHLIHLLSTDDTPYQPLARANSGLYFESWSERTFPYSNYPRFGHQDFLRTNVDYGTRAQDLTDKTEARSANQCNTPFRLTGADSGSCYYDGEGWYSANTWKTDQVVLLPDQWVKISGYVKMNSFTEGVANFDGIIRVWVDDQPAIESTRAQFAAGAYAKTRWDKLVLAPWIGNGSPISQTMWLDDLRIWSVVGPEFVR